MPFPLLAMAIPSIAGALGSIFGGRRNNAGSSGGGGTSSAQLGQALGGVGDLIGSLGLGNQVGEWNQNALVALWNRAQQGDELAREMFARFSDPLRDNALNVGQTLMRPVVDQAPGILEANQLNAGNVNDLLQQYTQSALSPEMQRLNASGEATAARSGAVGDLAAQLFAGGGWSQQSQDLMDLLMPMASGRGSNTQLALGDVAPTLLSQRGQTAFTQAMQDRASEASLNRGLSPDLQYAIDRAKDTLGAGGETGVSREMTGRGLDIFAAATDKALNGDLLSPQDAANWAREEATNDILAQAQAMYRQAQARGGGPGSLTASGTGQQMLADFADVAARLQADQARKAFGEQEGRKLQERGIAASLAGTGANLAETGQAQDIARTGQAYSAIPGTASAANQFLSAMLGAGANANENEVARMGAGTNMAQVLQSGQLGASNAFAQALANQNQYALGGGQLANQTAGTQSNIFNNLFGNLLGAGQLGTQQGSAAITGRNAAQGNVNNFWANLAQTQQGAFAPLTNLSGQALGYGGQYVSLMGAPFARLQGPTSQQGPNYGAIGAGLGGLIGQLGSGGGGATGPTPWPDGTMG